MAKEQANYPASKDVLVTDWQATDIVTSASYDIIEDAITEMQAEMRRVTTKTEATTLTSSEGGLVLVTAAAPYTLGLPAASGDLTGLTYFIVKTDDNTNLVTIDANASETINGVLTYAGLNKQWKWVILRLDGSNWIILAEPKAQASDVKVSKIGTVTYDDMQDFIDNTQSGGRISGGDITDDTDGTITVSSGTGFIQTTTGDIGLTQSFDWAADSSTGVALTDNSANYVYVDYNAGTPKLRVTTTRGDIHLTDHFTLGRVYRVGTSLHILNSGVNLFNMVRREHERLVTVRGFERASGGVISESAVTERALTSTIGDFYLGDNKITTEAQDTSTGDTDTFTYWYYDGANWQSSTGETQIDNTQYNTSTGLAPLTVNRYGVHWTYIHYDSDINVVYGQDDYTLANAESAVVPDSLPSFVEDFGILASKIIIQKDSASFNSIVTAYKVLFPVTNPAEHNDLGALDTADYQHLTQAEHDANVYSSGTFTAGRLTEISSTGGVIKASPFAVTTGDVFDFGAHSAVFTEQAIATTTGSAAINWNNGLKALFTRSTGAGGAVTFTFTAPVKSANLMLTIKGSTAGSTGVITWPTVYWQGGAVPTLTTGVSAIDSVAFYYSTGLAAYLGLGSVNFSTV